MSGMWAHTRGKADAADGERARVSHLWPLGSHRCLLSDVDPPERREGDSLLSGGGLGRAEGPDGCWGPWVAEKS